jgi:hypothetical protein
MAAAKRLICPTTSTPTSATQPVKLDPDAYYITEAVLTAIPWMKASTLRREIRLGRLRAAERCGRHLFRGQWLLDWLASGELAKQTPPEAPTGSSQS